MEKYVVGFQQSANNLDEDDRHDSSRQELPKVLQMPVGNGELIGLGEIEYRHNEPNM